MTIFDLNWIAVIAAAASGFIVGGIWYRPIMGKRWMGAVGITEAEIQQGHMGKVYGGVFAFSLLASWVLAHSFASYGIDFTYTTKVLTAVGIAIGCCFI